MNSEVVVLHWIYVIVMALGAAIVALMSKDSKGVPKTEYLINFIIPVWSGIAYFSIAIGQGITEVGDEIVYFARYADWIVTTPLLLVSLALTAMYRGKKDKILIAILAVLDIVMVLCGLFGDLSDNYLRYVWFGIGVVAFLGILYVIWIPLRNIAMKQGASLYRFYVGLAGYLTILWIGYPTTWILGPSGLGVISDRADVYLFIILPIFSKVGFGIIDLIGLRGLQKKYVSKK